MKATNGAWNMCINKCIEENWLFEVNTNKGQYNSEHYNILHDQHRLRDVLYQKPQNTLLCILIRSYVLFLKIKLSRIIYAN